MCLELCWRWWQSGKGLGAVFKFSLVGCLAQGTPHEEDGVFFAVGQAL
jgi:hypothetical protein